MSARAETEKFWQALNAECTCLGDTEVPLLEHARNLAARLDAVVEALEPGPMPVEEQFQFSLRPEGNYKHAHDRWTQRRHLHARIKAIVEGTP